MNIKHHVLKHNDLSLSLFTNNQDILTEIGVIEYKVANIIKKIQFSTADPNYCTRTTEFSSRRSRFNKFFIALTELPFTLQLKFFFIMDKHSRFSPKPYDFSKLFKKLQNFCASEIDGEENIILALKTLNEAELIRLNASFTEVTGKPIEPLRLILNLLNDDYLFTNYITNILFHIGLKKFKPRVINELKTSCTHSALSVVSIFVGKTRFLQIEKILRSSFISNNEYFTFGSKLIPYQFRRINMGKFISEIRKSNPVILLKDDYTEFCTELHQKYKNLGLLLQNHVNKNILSKFNLKNLSSWKVSDEEALTFVKKVICKYPFNVGNLDSLICEMEVNATKTSIDQSFCYYVNIKKASGAIDHAFVIEQYFKNGISFHRLYQSWIGQTTLLEDLKKNGAGNEGFQGLSIEDIMDLLERLRAYFSPAYYNNDALSQVFGYPWNKPIEVVSWPKEGIQGCDLLYWCEGFNPHDCLSNFLDIMSEK